MALFKKKDPMDFTPGFVESAKSRSRSDRIFDGVLMGVLTLIFLLVAYPLYFVVIASISEPMAVQAGRVIAFPIGLTWEGYGEVFKHPTVMQGFFNSVLYTVVGVLINLAVTIPTAYALSRKDFMFRMPIIFFYIVTMFISGGIMPTYNVIRDTGLIDSIWALVIPGALGVYNMIVARTFFQANIPDELLEASKLDGCGNTRFFISICLPLSGAIIAIMVLYYGVGHWNSYFSSLLYLNDRAKWPLQMELRSILILNSMNQQQGVMDAAALAERDRLQALRDMMKYSLIIVSSIPMLLLYPFIQRHFVKGVTIGSVKG